MKKFHCPDCGEGFDNIFEYLELHEIEVEMYIKLGNGLNLDLMTMFNDLYYLNEEGEKEEVAHLLTGVAAALYASAKGYLPDILDEIDHKDEEVIDEIVRQEVEDLDEKLQKLLRAGKTEEPKDEQ
jgi:hypothetical protein